MKLGTETRSITNWLYSRMTKGQPLPEVGMGATVLCWTDRHACTVISVGSIGRKGSLLVRVQEDIARRADKNGMSECQEYEYTPNPKGYVRAFKFDEKRGTWRQMWLPSPGEAKRPSLIKGGLGLRIGQRDHYHDYSF